MEKINLENLPHNTEKLHEIVKTLHARLTHAEETNQILRLKLFAPKSERIVTDKSADQAGLFDEAEVDVELAKLDQFMGADESPDASYDEEEDNETEESKKTKPRGKRKPLPANLPREDRIIELQAAELVCEADGSTLAVIGEEVSERLEIIPKQVKVIRTIRKKYGCRVCESNVKTAPCPLHILPKTNAGNWLIAYVMISKYIDHLPLFRMEEIFERMSIEIGRGTLARWMIKVSDKLQPLMNLLEEEMMESSYLQCDETWVQVLNEKNKVVLSNKYMWVRYRPGKNPIVIYEYDPSRSGEVPKRLLEGFEGYLQVDGYGGYNALEREGKIIRVGCLAHVRRKFFEIQKAAKGKGVSSRILALIRKLYKIEKAAKGLSAEARLEMRKKESTQYFDLLDQLIADTIPKTPPSGHLGLALLYAEKELKKIRRVLENGEVEISNNWVENAIRPFALGRKNWLFSATVEGAHSSARIYSLLQTAKENGKELYPYLVNLFEKLPYAETLADFEALLPNRP